MYYILSLLSVTALYGLGLSGGRAGRLFVALGLLLHAGFTLYRISIIETVPVTERLDILSLIGLLLALAYLLFTRGGKRRHLEYSFLPLSALFTFLAIFHPPIDRISPFLESPWFYLHSGFNLLSYVLLGISALFAGHYLFEEQEEYEPLSYRWGLWGWAVFSGALLCGSVWFFLAYGSYWYWTAREFWLSLTWFYYAIYLHGRLVPELRGRPAALMGLLGYPLLLFAYFGIGTIIKSPWSQF